MSQLGRGIASHVAAWTATALMASMVAYGGYQYATVPGVSLVGLFTSHIAHVVIIGILVYGVLWIGVKRSIVGPVRVIGSHLYGVGMGETAELSLDSGVSEIHQLVSSVNLMIRRMAIRRDDVAIERVWRDIDSLGLLGRRLVDDHPLVSVELLSSAERIEKALLGLVPRYAEKARESTRPSALESDLAP